MGRRKVLLQKDDPLKNSAIQDISTMLTSQDLHVIARSLYKVLQWGYGEVELIVYKGKVVEIRASTRMRPTSTTETPFDNPPI
jgi:hypothetical protein